MLLPYNYCLPSAYKTSIYPNCALLHTNKRTKNTLDYLFLFKKKISLHF